MSTPSCVSSLWQHHVHTQAVTPNISSDPYHVSRISPDKKKKNDGLVGIEFKNSVTAQEEELILRRYLDDESIQDGRFPRSVTINETKTVPKKKIHHE